MSELLALVQQCAPAVHPSTMAAVLRVESTFNPYAIGVVKGQLARQPTNKAEAVATAKALAEAGYNFSLGLGQVNRYNLSKYGLDYETAFDPCANLGAASLILKDCYDRAKRNGFHDTDALPAALSCYYSGNFVTGFIPEGTGQQSYVQRVFNGAVVREDGSLAASIRIAPVLGTKPTTNAPFSKVKSVFRVTGELSGGGSAEQNRSASVRDSVMVYR